MRSALLLLLGGVVAPLISYADTEMIELTCDLYVTTQPPHGEPKRSHETAGLEMLFDATTGFKAIALHSVAIPVAVANKKGGAVTAFVDNSDDSRWEISNRRDRSKVASEQSAAIDRNTGEITAHSVTTVGDASQRVEARGTCVKVDTSRRKLWWHAPRGVAAMVGVACRWSTADHGPSERALCRTGRTDVLSARWSVGLTGWLSDS